MLVKVLLAIIGIAIVAVFWRELLWIALILGIGFIIFSFVTAKKAVEVKEEIDKDPETYFEKQQQAQEEKREEGNLLPSDIQKKE